MSMAHPTTTQPAERAWQEQAWASLCLTRPSLLRTTLDAALRDRLQGPLIRGFAAQLRRKHGGRAA